MQASVGGCWWKVFAGPLNVPAALDRAVARFVPDFICCSEL